MEGVQASGGTPNGNPNFLPCSPVTVGVVGLGFCASWVLWHASRPAPWVAAEGCGPLHAHLFVPPGKELLRLVRFP